MTIMSGKKPDLQDGAVGRDSYPDIVRRKRVSFSRNTGKPEFVAFYEAINTDYPNVRSNNPATARLPFSSR